jgi:aspartate 1-decarboxylase
MKRTLLKSKIHRATVTDASLHYEGSITIDPLLMQAADICEWEQVDVYDINNGNRLTTYAIPGKPGSGVICLNGAAAQLVHIGDLVIICSYAEFSEEERERMLPKLCWSMKTIDTLPARNSTRSSHLRFSVPQPARHCPPVLQR